jgi:hypothetical protein
MQRTLKRKEPLKRGGKALPPTPANVKQAHWLAAEVRRLQSAGLFDDDAYARLFPESSVAVRFWKRLLGEDTTLDELPHGTLADIIGSHPWKSPKSHDNYLIACEASSS